MNTIDKLLLLKEMKKEIGRDYGDGIQVLTHNFEIQDDSRLTAVVKIDVSFNDRTGITNILEGLVNKNRVSNEITNTITNKLKVYIENEIYRIRKQVKDVLDV